MSLLLSEPGRVGVVLIVGEEFITELRTNFFYSCKCDFIVLINYINRILHYWHILFPYFHSCERSSGRGLPYIPCPLYRELGAAFNDLLLED